MKPEQSFSAGETAIDESVARTLSFWEVNWYCLIILYQVHSNERRLTLFLTKSGSLDNTMEGVESQKARNQSKLRPSSLENVCYNSRPSGKLRDLPGNKLLSVLVQYGR